MKSQTQSPFAFNTTKSIRDPILWQLMSFFLANLEMPTVTDEQKLFIQTPKSRREQQGVFIAKKLSSRL